MRGVLLYFVLDVDFMLFLIQAAEATAAVLGHVFFHCFICFFLCRPALSGGLAAFIFRLLLLQDVCEAGGETFQAVFGARTPLIESFLIKRKLMGPCWVTVRNPKVSQCVDLPYTPAVLFSR